MNNIFSEIRNNYKVGNGFTKLLYLNLFFFVIYTIIWVPFNEIETIIKYLSFPSKTDILIHKPWTFLSYMFIHTDSLHILSNMVFLYFGSKLFLKHFNNKQLITTYILGGICGAIFFKLLFNLFPEYANFNSEKELIGASAGVFAIMIAASTYRPNSLISLPFIGNIKLKYIAWSAIILFYLGIGNSPNPGGHIAHLGGALFGYMYIKQLQKGNDFSIGFTKWINNISNLFKPKSKLKTVHKRKKTDTQFNTEKSAQQIAVDIVLEKISKSGYESLSKEEKATLFSASKK
jgi:membrane associated rhomboid family serine protease